MFLLCLSVDFFREKPWKGFSLFCVFVGEKFGISVNTEMESLNGDNRIDWKLGSLKADLLTTSDSPRRAHLYIVKYSALYFTWKLCRKKKRPVQQNKMTGGWKMSKLVARMEKMKAGNLGGIQRHNQRETTNHSNKEIDVERSHLNYDLVNQESIHYQERIFEIIDKQRVSKRAVRKDAVLVDEWIITSDKLFFETADSRKFFEDSLAYFSERCGSQTIAYAAVHMDETTPHMHLGVVPMIEGRLSSKQVFSRQSLKEIQEELPGYLQSKGHTIERGLKGSEQKHLTVEEYKENQREIGRMREQVRDLTVKAEYMSFEMVATRQQIDSK